MCEQLDVNGTFTHTDSNNFQSVATLQSCPGGYRVSAARTTTCQADGVWSVPIPTVQGRWLEWTDVVNSDLSWRRLIHGIDDGELSFTLRAITYTLPTPENLRRWGQHTTDPACPLCGRHATLRHILNGCSIALRQGRYTWRHDNVLRILKRHLTDFWEALQRENNHPPANLPFIHVVREGCPQLPNRNQSRRPLFNNDTLRCASDWKILFNIDGGYQNFPMEIAATSQRLNIVIYSLSLHTVLLIELTVPLEDRVAAAHNFKTARYASLMSASETNGFKAIYFAVQVGSRGFIAHSLLTCTCLRSCLLASFPQVWMEAYRIIDSLEQIELFITWENSNYSAVEVPSKVESESSSRESNYLLLEKIKLLITSEIRTIYYSTSQRCLNKTYQTCSRRACNRP